MVKKLRLFFASFFWSCVIGLGASYAQCPSGVGIDSDVGNTICEGTTATFTASVQDDAAYDYQWTINGGPVGPNTYTFPTSNLQNGDKVRVTISDAGDTCQVSSDAYTMTVNPNETPTLSVSADMGSICPSGSVTLRTKNTNGGSQAQYAWSLNGSSLTKTGDVINLSGSELVPGSNTISVVMTSSLECVTQSTAEATTTVTLLANTTITAPASPDRSPCINTAMDPISFSIGGDGTGASASGLPPGVSGSYDSGTFTIRGTPTTAGEFTYTVTATGACEPATASGIISVQPDATISLSSGSATQSVCQGQEITPIVYSIGETGMSAQVSGLPTDLTTGYANGSFTISGASSSVGTFAYTITATGTCGDSPTLSGTITIAENLTPSVSITSSDADHQICAGTEVTFTAAPVNGGDNPSYQWKIGTTNVGNDQPTFTTSNLSNGEVVSVVLTSSAECVTTPTATSDPITTHVNPNLTPSVTVSPSDTDICSGDPVTFTATPTHGGTAPTYQWKIGNSVVGTNSPEFTTSALTDGQAVTVTLTSSESCLAVPTATSDPVTIEVDPNLTPEVTITSNDSDHIICAGATVTFTANPTNGGSAPTYQWLINESPVSGESGATFSTSTLSNGDVVSVVLNSNAECLQTITANSNKISVQVDSPITAVDPTAIRGSSAVCPVVSGLVYSIDPIPGATSYEWDFPSGWSITSGGNTPSVTVNASANAAAGMITVQGRNDCGPSSSSSLEVSTGTVVYVSAGPDQVVCAGTTNITLAGEVGGVIKNHNEWDWAASLTGGSFSDDKQLDATYTLPASIRDGGSMSINITSIDPSGDVCGPKSDEMTITVLPQATITDPTNKSQTVCIQSAISPVAFSVTGAAKGATVSGIPPGISGAFQDGTFTLSGTPTQAGTFNYTVSTTGDCTDLQTSQTGTFTVKPDPTISSPANKDQTVCIDSAITAIDFTITSPGSGATVSGLPEGITGTFTGNTYSLAGSPTEAGTFEYTVTTTGDCVQRSVTGTLTINPDPTLSDPVNKNQTVCIDASITPIEFAITAPASGASVTGLPQGVTGNFANGTYTIRGTPSESGEFSYTVSTTGGCVPATREAILTVTPKPTASISYPTSPFCSMDASAQNVSLTGTNHYQGGTYSSSTGLSLDPDTGEIIPSTSTPGRHTVTYTTPESGDCPAVTATTEVVITETPSAAIHYAGPFCTSTSTAQPVSFSSTIGAYTGGTFTASPSGLDIDPSSGEIYPATSNPATYTVTYTIPASEGCEAVAVTTEVIITQIPQVSISYGAPFCSADSAAQPVTFSETAGAYESGTFSGTSGLAIDQNGSIIPATSTPGTHTITYTIEAAAGCGVVEATTQIEILQEPVITTQPVNVGICSTEPAEFTVVATGDQLSYQWYKDDTAVAGATSPTLSFANATADDAGQYHVVVSGAGVCSAKTSETVSLTVDENIVIIKPAENETFCNQDENQVTFEYIAHANGAPLEFNWIKDGADLTLDPSKYEVSRSEPSGENGEYTGSLTILDVNPDDNGVYAVRIEGPDYFTCSDATSKTFTLSVTPLPEAPTVQPITYCQGEAAAPLTADGQDLSWYSLDETTGTYTFLGKSFTPPTTEPGTTSYWVTQTMTCESPYSELVVTVLPTPEPPSTQELVEYCFNEEVTAPLSATGSEGATINWYDTAESDTPLTAAPMPNTSSTGVRSYWVSQTTDGCESPRVKVSVAVNQLPQITVTSDAATICPGSSTTLYASGATTYSWSVAGTEIDGPAGETIVSPTETTTYVVTGTDAKGCSSSAEITITVEKATEGGQLSGPASVCTGSNSGTLKLSEYVGDIQRWERSEDGANWTAVNVTTDTLQFDNLSAPTHFRAIVKSGVCEEEPSTVHQVGVDPLPQAGGLLFNGTDRVFMMCEFPTSDYLVPLSTSGTYVGEIVAWEYKRSSQSQWNVISGTNGNFTGTTLSGEQVINASNNETTMFRVEVQSGACTPNVYSEVAVLSIVPSDIAPNPVSVTQEAICIGDTISLSSGTGYATGGDIVGGAFDNSSIANHGWRVRHLGSTTELNFESSADNIRPQHWLRVTPKEFPMYDHNSGSEVMQLFDSSSDNEGNKGFAIVSGDNPSTLETPVFNTYAMEEATLTFDQAYNLYSEGSSIRVEVSTDGGNTYTDTLFEVTAPAVSENYASFGDGTADSRPLNKIVVNLEDYVGQGNLRIRFVYDGSSRDIWTVDDIAFPDDPQNVQLIWYYDEDLDDPNNELEQIGEVNQNTVQFTPTKIGWNDFEVQTALVFDTNGDPCESAENSQTIRVYVFDSYSTTATTTVGSCGSLSAQLQGTITGANQGEISAFPEGDESTVAWEVVSGPEGYSFSPEHFTNTDSTTPAVEDPNAIFQPDVEGEYTLRWMVTPDPESTCEVVAEEVTFNVSNCTTLDFDGIDDYVSIPNSFTQAQTIGVWVRPEAENGPGSGKVATIFSTENYELFLNAGGKPVLKYYGKTLTSNQPLALDGRWYHLAVVFSSSAATMYIDGIEITDKTTGVGTSTGTGEEFIVGARFNGSSVLPDNHFSGWIEELRIWNTALRTDQIRFMMNQRLIDNGAQMGAEIPMEVPGGLTYSNLLGYYRLISANPDPSNLVPFDTALMPLDGLTPDLAGTLPGRLHNMTTDQENTAPLPYISAVDGQQWATDNTWIRPTVWDPPNSTGVTGDPITWNIAITRHHIQSGNKDITVLGLKSETPDKVITMANPSSSMDEHNSGQMMRVTHYLLLNGNIDLVGESQLLQDQGSLLAAESAGWLERDQQGKRLSYNYNYWSSPVSAQGAATNAPYSVGQILLDGSNAASPVEITFRDQYAAADGVRTQPITISNYWIWKFLGTADIYEEWFHIGSTGTLKTGEGYTMKGTDGTARIADKQNYTFRGKPHNGDFTLQVSKNQNYLVGNPYPSALDAREFILDNLKDVKSGDETGRNTSNVFNGAIYYWDHFAGKTHYLERYIGGYATWTLAGGTEAISNDERINANLAHGTKEPGQYIPVAQGFFVNTVMDPVIEQITGITVSGGPIVFKNRQRIYERETGTDPESVFHSQEQKGPKQSSSDTTDERKKIWLKFRSPLGYHRQILVTADPSTSNGFDLGYDAPLIENNEEDMYWYFSNYEFVIQAVESFHTEQELPLGMKIHEKGSFTVSIDQLKNVPEEMNIFLEDSLLQVTHDLRKESYTAQSDTGTFHNRLKIIFKDPKAVVDEPQPSLEEGEFEILYINGSREILVRNPQLLNIEEIYLNNVLGQQLHMYYDIPVQKELRLPVQRFSSGVYILKVHSEKGIRTKKIILE